MKSERFLREELGMRRRLFMLAFGVLAAFLVLLARLWYLQVLHAGEYRDLSESNRLRLVPVAAPRGTILDRNGAVLVGNRPSFSLGVVLQEVKDKELLLDRVAALLHDDRAELVERLEKSRKRSRFFPLLLASNLSRDQVERLEENRLTLPGIDVGMRPLRDYPNGRTAAHLLGHIGEINDQELDLEEYADYNPGDFVGKGGVERTWERELHGRDGGRQLEVDARGRILRTLSETDATVGNSLVLTIDVNMQKAAEAAFGSQAGAAVALDINSGEVLAFVSNPNFDPALFAGRMPPEVWKGYLEDKRHPLEDKALKGQYPPGSTFKVITALAGLEAGLIDASTTVTCTGSHKLGNQVFRCWNKKGHGQVNLKKALRESCDVYFYILGEKLGIDRIAECARRFGLGQPTGIGLDGEKAGLIPTTAWKEKRHKKAWLRGDTLPAAIGQGYVLLTPIQLATMIAGVASEGTVYRPHLVKRIVDQDGKTVREFAPELLAQAGMQARNYRLVKEGLLAVVQEPGGTGGAARVGGVRVAGKTGTAQVVKQRDDRGAVAYQYRDHALFVAFAPYDKPEIAVGVVVEHGGHGGGTAGPIAGRIIQAWLEGKNGVRRGGKPGEEAAGAVPPANGEGD